MVVLIGDSANIALPDVSILYSWSNLDQLSEAIETGEVFSSGLEQILSEQTQLLTGVVCEPARYSVSDLALDNSISGFAERIESAQIKGHQRLTELNTLSDFLDKLIGLSDGYQSCAIATTAAKQLLLDTTSSADVSDGGEANVEALKDRLERLSEHFRHRHVEISRVIAETARRVSDIAIFVEDLQPVVFVYSVILERHHQVTHALQLTNPSPALQAELKQIEDSTRAIRDLENNLIEANEATRKKVKKIKEDYQKRLDRLNPLKALEGLAQTIESALSDVASGTGDLGRGINVAWNDARREIWIGLENVFREFTVGLCRLQHGSPDKDKDGNGNGKNAGFYKCMDEGWHASVTVSDDGEVTSIVVDPPGLPVPISVDLVTDADRRAEKQRIEQRADAIRKLNEAVREHFQPGPDIELNKDFFDEINSRPDSFIKPFGLSTFPLLGRDAADIEPYTDKNGKVWPSKRAYKAALTEIHISRIDSALDALQSDVISNEFIQLGTFWFASIAAYETAVGMVKDISSATAKGAMTLFAVTRDIATGDDISLRMLVNVSGIPLVDTFEAWITLQTWQTDAASARASQLETLEVLREQKKLLEDNLRNLQGN